MLYILYSFIYNADIKKTKDIKNEKDKMYSMWGKKRCLF